MNKLWVRLALAFGVVTAIAIIIAALLANRQVSTEFRLFVMHDQMRSSQGPLLIEYYAANGSWSGVEAVIDSTPRQGGMGMGHGMQLGRPNLVLADATGQVIYSRSDETGLTQLNAKEIAEAIPLEWQGQLIGYLQASPPGQTELTGPAQAFLNQINRSLLQAGLIAGILGVLIGVVIAWRLSAPLGRLATAARHISQGELDQRVPIKGTDELTDLAQAFNEMAAYLQEAETLRRNLVADVAHELRTPLSVIQGNLRAILDDIYPLDKEEIASIYDETLILNRLISDLRELAQAEAGQLSLNIQPTALSPIIEATTDLFTELSREKGIELNVTLPQNLPDVLIDPDRTRQILQNLLFNALRHTPAGGRIDVRVKPSPLSPHLNKQGDTPLIDANEDTFILVTVTDSGPGIPEYDLAHVFDRFWRADKSRSREQGGLGLGLAIARQLVEAQEGQIGVESEGIPGRGSCFWFTLPVALYNNR